MVTAPGMEPHSPVKKSKAMNLLGQYGVTAKDKLLKLLATETLPEHKTNLHLSNARTYILHHFSYSFGLLSALRADVLLSESIFNKPPA